MMVRNGAFCLEGVAFAHNPHFLSSILLLAGFLQGPFASSRKGPPSIEQQPTPNILPAPVEPTPPPPSSPPLDQ